MAIENAPFIAGMNEAIPANTDPRAEGAGQIRAIKTALKNSFPNVDDPVTATAARMNEVFNSASQVPQGAIVLWSSTNLPTGWVECNGQTVNGITTPDMRGLFVRGVDSENTVGATGGNDSPLLSEHLEVGGHALSMAELPAQGVGYRDRYYPEENNKLVSEGASNITPNDSPNTIGSNASDSDNDAMLYVDSTTDNLGQGVTHDHPITDVVANPFDNRPAYISLRYICYVGQ